MWLLFWLVYLLLFVCVCVCDLIKKILSTHHWCQVEDETTKISHSAKMQEIHWTTLFLLGTLSSTAFTFFFILGGWGNLIVKEMLSILCWCVCSRRHEQCPSPNRNPNLKTRPLSGPKCYILKLVSWHFKPSQPQRITSGLIIFCWSASFPSER